MAERLGSKMRAIVKEIIWNNDFNDGESLSYCKVSDLTYYDAQAGGKQALKNLKKAILNHTFYPERVNEITQVEIEYNGYTTEIDVNFKEVK